MDIIAAKVFSMRWRKAIQAKKESRNYMPGGWLENDSAPFLGNIPDACRTYSATFIHTKRKRRRSSSASERSSFIAKSPESNVSKTSGTLISDGAAVNDKNDNMIRVDIPAQHLTSKISPNGIISASPVSETAKLLGEKVCFGCGRMMPSYSYAYNLFSKGMSHYGPDVVEQFLPVPEVDLIEHSRPRRNTMNDFILSTSNCKNKGQSEESPPCSCPSCLLKLNKNRRKVRFSEDLTHSISRVEQWVASMESSCDSPSLEVYVPTSVESTPEPADDVTMSSPDSIAGDNVFLSDVQDKLTDSSSERSSSMAGDDEEDRQAGLQVPIVGFEVMEQRARFTVFKIHVQRTKHENWFVFRRYTDFVQLNEKLKEIFPSFRLTLPPKRWFGSNFDDHFLEERSAGLQAFLNNITGHRKVSHSQPVRQFLCLDDPPGPHDSLEESRALCESLEETVYNTRRDLQERDAKVELLEGEIAMYKAQIDALNDSLRKTNAQIGRIERQYHRLRRASANSKTPSESSLQDVETDSTSFPESDQFRIKQSTVENTNPVMVVDSNQNSEPSIKVIDKLVKKSQDGAGDASAMEPS